ncbi:MAG: efflux RND transporter periplasmic adaptor subunit [Marinibacterium sp.]|nr:efflux RND transporter periplasmic adaptor subunit [Marinibacterium sp.]
MFARLFLVPLLVLLIGTSGLMAQDDPPQPVKLLTVTPTGVLPERVFFGRVVAKETVNLAFQVGGQVLTLPVTQGEVVPAGTLVGQLDLEPFELGLEQAELQKAQADRTLRRYDQLSSSTISRVAREDAETAAALADVALRNARFDLRHATISAPFDALVAERLVANFTTVSPGQPVVTLHDMSDLRIEVDVPEVLFQRTGNNANLEIVVEFPATDGSFPVEIREFRAESSEIGQTYKVTLGMTPPPDLVLLPGASARVRARVMDDTAPPVLPSAAIAVANDGSTSVLVFDADADTPDLGTLRRQPVTIRPNTDGGMTVTDGLEAGQEVVATGLVQLDDGMRVRRFLGFPE